MRSIRLLLAKLYISQRRSMPFWLRQTTHHRFNLIQTLLKIWRPLIPRLVLRLFSHLLRTTKVQQNLAIQFNCQKAEVPSVHNALLVILLIVVTAGLEWVGTCKCRRSKSIRAGEFLLMVKSKSIYNPELLLTMERKDSSYRVLLLSLSKKK